LFSDLETFAADFSFADIAFAIFFIFRTFFDLFIGLPFCFTFLSQSKSVYWKMQWKCNTNTIICFANKWKLRSKQNVFTPWHIGCTIKLNNDRTRIRLELSEYITEGKFPLWKYIEYLLKTHEQVTGGSRNLITISHTPIIMQNMSSLYQIFVLIDSHPTTLPSITIVSYKYWQLWQIISPILTLFGFLLS